MRAAIYPGGGRPITIETPPDPGPGPGEVLLRVQRCGICGTDISMTRGKVVALGGMPDEVVEAVGSGGCWTRPFTMPAPTAA